MARVNQFLAIGMVALALGCARQGPRVLTISGSVVGREAEILKTQLGRFARLHPDIPVALRATPDAADQRHQLYVQWLNAQGERARRAAARRRLDRGVRRGRLDREPRLASIRRPIASSLLPWRRTAGGARCTRCRGSSTSACCTGGPISCRGRPAIWQIWRGSPPSRSASGPVPFGFVWQGARYEGLVTVFLEHLGAFGGRDPRRPTAASSWIRTPRSKR